MEHKSLPIAYAMMKRAKKEKAPHEDEPIHMDGGGLLGSIMKMAPLAMAAMADGGEVEDPQPTSTATVDPQKAAAVSSSFKKALGYADGGMAGPGNIPYKYSQSNPPPSKAKVGPPVKQYDDDDGGDETYGGDDDTPDTSAPIAGAYAHGDIVERCMQKRMCHGGKMSEGGMVANDVKMEPLDHDATQYDDLVNRDDLEDPGMHDDMIGNAEQDHERDDIVSRIMRMRKHGKGMPSPA